MDAVNIVSAAEDIQKEDFVILLNLGEKQAINQLINRIATQQAQWIG